MCVIDWAGNNNISEKHEFKYFKHYSFSNFVSFMLF